MKQSGGGFKRNLFGGFDRKDVSKYILSLAKERNAHAAKCRELAETVSQLEDESELLREKLRNALDETERLREKLDAVQIAESCASFDECRRGCSDSLETLRTSFDSVRRDMESFDGALAGFIGAADSLRARMGDLAGGAEEEAAAEPETEG